MKEEQKEALYALLLHGAKAPLREAEELLAQQDGNAFSGQLSEGECCLFLERLGQALSEVRSRMTALLSSEEAEAFDKDLVYDAKRHIHTDIGRLLTLMRVYPEGASPREGALPDAERMKQRQEIDAKCREVLKTLHTGRWQAEQTDVKGQLLAAAEAIGLSLSFEREPPGEEAALRAYVKEASARMAEAVKAGQSALLL